MLRATLTLVLLGLLVLAGCTTAQQGRQAAPAPRPVTVDVDSEPNTLNPVAGYAPDGAAQFYEGLLEHRADGRFEPALATALPQPDATGTHWTVPLRDNVRFSDGSTLRPADVVATYRAVLNPRVDSPLRTRFANLNAVEQTSDGQIRFDLNRKDPDFPTMLTLGIVPANSVQTKRPATSWPISSHPIGTGPFRFTGWRHGAELSMAARSDYRGGKPSLGTVIVRFQPEQQRRIDDLRTKKADVARVSNDQRQSPVEGTGAVNALSAEYRAVSLPAGNPVTADPAVREAMNRAVDRQAIVHEALDDIGEPASTPFTSAQAEYQDPSAEYRHDQNGAQQALDRAGWSAEPGGVRAKGNLEARFTLRYPDGDPEARALASAVSAQLRTVGIQVDSKPGAAAAGEAALIAQGDPFQPGIPDTTADAQTEPEQRAIAYRAADRAYFAQPTMVVLARMEHTYLVADRLRDYQPVLDSARPGFNWGLAWNMKDWANGS